ncbi:hypothetical protein GCM10023169_29820 [Georgenia halophila]|uniref:Gfo/Idh/MocA-like oxidoreductase N-terminal domain-containing protein n=1 Tax=Georgenia halophila TaxID=620889 RepID=A0ABP8LG97_9MICO
MITMPLTLSLNELDDKRDRDRLNTVIGSLPMTFRPADDAAVTEPKDVVAVGGPRWAGRMMAAAASGARAILLADPWPLDAVSLREVASVTCPVVIDAGWRHSPAVDAIRDGVARYRRPDAVLEVRSTAVPGTDLLRASVGLLDLVTATAGGLIDLAVLRRDERHLVLSGRLTDETIAMITIVTTHARPRCASLSISGSDGRAQLLLPDPATAASPIAKVTDPSGQTMLPIGHESAHRVAMKRLAAAVIDSTAAPDDLPRFVDYARLLLIAVEQEPVSSGPLRIDHGTGAM